MGEKMCSACRYDELVGIMSICRQAEAYQLIIKKTVELVESTRDNPISYKRLDTFWANQYAKDMQGKNCAFFKPMPFFRKLMRKLPNYGENLKLVLLISGVVVGVLAILVALSVWICMSA